MSDPNGLLCLILCFIQYIHEKKVLNCIQIMNIKTLISLSLMYSLIQVLPASAGVNLPTASIQNVANDCQLNGVICNKTININNNTDYSNINNSNVQVENNKLAGAGNGLIVVRSDCGAQISRKVADTPLSQIFVDLSKGESLSNALYAFQGLTFNQTQEVDNGLDYDTISQLDTQNCHVNEVPAPAAGWLFASALIGFITYSNRRRV